ncbi:response regulator [Kiritimatiellaeota bacterium B1221]|nr:response regulator [Kiritimatiellaeota bacterium B1221]
MDLEDITDLTLEKKLSLYQQYLKDFYPSASLKFLYMCEGTHLEILDVSGQGQEVSNGQKKLWKKAILQQNYAPIHFERSLSILHPFYALDVDCEHMVACIYFPKATGFHHHTDPFWHGLGYVAGYTGIFLLCIFLGYGIKKKPCNPIKWQALICGFGFFGIGVLFSIQLSGLTNHVENNTRIRVFENYAASVTSRIQDRLVEIETRSLQHLVAFIEASNEVTVQEFRRFTQDIRSSKNTGIWYWIPEPGEKESPVIQYNSHNDDLNIPLAETFPQETAVIEEILNQSRQANRLSASDIHTCKLHNDPIIFIAHPVSDGPSFQGWVASTITLKLLVDEGLQFGNLNPNAVDLNIVEMKDSEHLTQSFIHTHAFVRPVYIFERLYLIHAAPNPLYTTLYPIEFNVWVAGAGGFISLIISIMLYQNLLRNYLLENKVQVRTRSLDNLLHKHQNITNNLPLGLALCENGVPCEMNPKMLTWFKSSDDLKNQLPPLIHEELHSGKKFKSLLPLQTQFGTRQMKCTLIKLPEDAGKDLHLILLEDWTEQLRSEQALSKKTLELERLFNSSTDLMCTSTLDGTFLNLNPQWEATLGHSVSEMTGQQWIHFVHDADREQAQKFLQRICDGAQKQIFTLRFEHCRGEEVWLEWKATREGNLIHANVRDITARINAEEKNRNMREHVARAQKMESIGRLAGGIAHDFNNSLQVIIGNAQLALTRPETPRSQKKQLQDILKAADRSARLTRQLLGFAMKQHIQADPTNLNEKLTEMEPMFKTILGDQIQLTWKLSSELAKVKMDSGQLEQICVSLLENARDAMARGGKLTITTENRDYTQTKPENLVIDISKGHYICFSIQDTGTGIDSSLLGTLFEPFSTTQDPSKGSGLGLATVYGILQQNNGSIRVESVPGHGTLMEVFLPRLTEGTSESSNTVKARAVLGKILVVDDNPQILQLSSLVLEELNYRVLTSSSPVAALKIIQEDPEVALLLTDVLMPDMTGQDLYEQALVHRPNLKCIFMSGYSSDVVEANFLQTGSCTFLHKPFTLEVVREAVAQLLQSPG